MDINELLELTVNKKASDLHLVAGASPYIRIDGLLIPQDYPLLTPESLEEMLFSILTDEQIYQLKHDLELDFSYSIPSLARFRGNIMYQRGSLAAVFRVVPYDVPDIKKLGLPQAVERLCTLKSGLVLVTGPTGSGKSTTLASMIELMNNSRSLNIVTIEDPIEFLHRHKKSIVRQREVGVDTHSFSEALRHVLRHDPDVILIGEMRDLSSVSVALTAAETGHLVLSTLHTQTAPLTISRIVDIFSHDEREQVRQQLANSLQAVISQKLIPHASGKGRVLAVELMLGCPPVRNLIRDNKEHQLYTVIQTNGAMGMQTMDQSLGKLYVSGKITREDAFENCVDRQELERIIINQGIGNGLFL
ncbi:MAG: type IV pilus twitching motility protein PilT [Xylanivirga thermophila]|jgi:twitching motility protein PilT|uniref:type IV pilus twitching motility protein PilT n=1 Tax=Xylanivirga thermophila TaxID=2496273 RepID=UPI00101C204B|nr:type IV pilus twitching motility protein PilT [Xylanivirga thermophila]